MKSVAGVAVRRFTVAEMFGSGEMEKSSAGKALLMLAALVMPIAGLNVAKSLFIPVLIAFFVATVSFPVLGFLQNKDVPLPVAVLSKAVWEGIDEFRWIGVAISSGQPTGITGDTLPDVTPPEKSKPAALLVGAENI
ncbi:MAG: hypothetical protein RLZZ505_835 [Verrucomicrobiota bacterium]|jgi:hypothetical protein